MKKMLYLLVVVTLYRERGKLKLYGSYSHGQKEGTLTLYKK